MGKLAQSIELLKATLTVLKKEKALIVLSFLSFVCTVIVFISFAYPAYRIISQTSFEPLLKYHSSVALMDKKNGLDKPMNGRQGVSFDKQAAITNNLDKMQTQIPMKKAVPAWFYVWLFLFYFLNFFVVIFFNSAIIACSYKLLKGEKTSVTDGLAIAIKRLPLIFQWALVSATVGVILKMLEERFGVIGRIVIGFIGMAWAVTSFMVLPVLVNEKKEPFKSLTQSVQILKKTWGEGLCGFAGIGLVFTLILLPVLAMVGSGIYMAVTTEATAFAVLLVLMGLALMFLLLLLKATLTTIFQAALYQYAVDGVSNENFPTELMNTTIVTRKERKGSWFRVR